MQLSAITLLTGLLALAIANPVPETSENTSMHLFKRRTCLNTSSRCQIDHARWCADRLISLGTQKCVVGSGGYTQMCERSGCKIYGRAILGASSATSYCRDVGYGAKNVVDNCQIDGRYVEGYNTAGGNGNFGVTITNNNI